MSDDELIRYCDIHCETQRALFSDTHINKMLELAGYPSNFVRSVPPGFHSVKSEMKELCSLARENIESRKNGTNVVFVNFSKAENVL